jgi:hypothetical protein
MSATDITAQRAAFDQANDLVACVLGLNRWLDELAACCEQPAATVERLAADSEELFVVAVLGMLSVRRTLQLWARSIEAVEQSVPAAHEPRLGRVRGLLR